MHDWLISRQRYWGTPIPMLYCEHCGTVPVPAAELPVLLPHVPDYLPRGDGSSPLANLAEFTHATCPRCSGPAQRETDTMGGFACSSWYFLRFPDREYADGPFNPKELQRWLPVDLYVGGAEHAVMHLLYARFWTKVLADAGLVDFREPFPRLRSQGILHASDGKRMSKSRGNVVTPDEIVERHGADILRIYLLFMAPFERNVYWDEEGIAGAERFLQRVWRLCQGFSAEPQDRQPAGPADASLQRVMHKTIQRVTGDIKAFKFNTAVAALMEYTNALWEHRDQHGASSAFQEAIRNMVRMVAPFAPHIAEELWTQMGGTYSVHQQAWPVHDPALTVEETITLVIQVNGKVRDRLSVPADIGDEEAQKMAMESERVQRYLQGARPKKTIVIPGRLVNLVI
jgi:leucyl-tRNA synthetase